MRLAPTTFPSTAEQPPPSEAPDRRHRRPRWLTCATTPHGFSRRLPYRFRITTARPSIFRSPPMARCGPLPRLQKHSRLSPSRRMRPFLCPVLTSPRRPSSPRCPELRTSLNWKRRANDRLLPGTGSSLSPSPHRTRPLRTPRPLPPALTRLAQRPQETPSRTTRDGPRLRSSPPNRASEEPSTEWA